jgi:DNA polymerase-3 subunit gamma/tau
VAEPVQETIAPSTPVVAAATPIKEQAEPESKESFATDSTPEPSAEKSVSIKGGRRFGRGNRVKISEAHLKIEEEVVDIEDLPKDAFSEEHLQKIWNDRVNLLFKEKPGILSSLTKHAIILKEEHIIELKLDGQHQLEHLQENRGILIEAIRKDLNNFSIQLETPVEEMVSVKKAYTPKEIYQSMVEENPNLQKLRDELDLDLDY